MQLTGNELHHLPAEFTRVNSFFAGSKMCLARGQPLAAIRKMLVIARALQAKGAKGGKAGHKGLPSRARAAEGTGLHVHLVMGNDKFLVGFKLPQHAVGRVFHAPVDVVGVKKVQEIMQRQVQDVGCLHAGSGKTGQGRLAPGCIAISQRRWPAGAFTGTGASATRRCGMHPAHRELLANPTKILPRGIEGKVQGTHLGQSVEPVVLVINSNDVPPGLAEAARKNGTASAELQKHGGTG